MNSLEYLFSKGIADMLFNAGLLTEKEHKDLDTLNISTFIEKKV